MEISDYRLPRLSSAEQSSAQVCLYILDSRLIVDVGRPPSSLFASEMFVKGIV